MIELRKFEHNGEIDWDGYRKAQIENGELCSKCGTYLWGVFGSPQECPDCRGLCISSPVEHEQYVRCPYCAHTDWVADDYELFSDGEHTIQCSNCQKDYTIITHVSVSFESPGLKTEPDAVEITGT